jgi:hypothetical protein
MSRVASGAKRCVELGRVMNARRCVIVAAFAGYLASPAKDDATAKARYEAGKATLRAESGLTQALSALAAHE